MPRRGAAVSHASPRRNPRGAAAPVRAGRSHGRCDRTADPWLPPELPYLAARRAWAPRRAAPMTLLGRDAILVRGAEGVATFYDEKNVARHGAMPAIVQRVLFGVGSVHSLDGPRHRHRKSTFADIAYEDDQVERMTRHLHREWRAELADWRAGGRRSAYTAAVGAFGRAVMRWGDLPGTPAAQTRWAGRLAQIVDGFGAPYSPSILLAVANRRWSDRQTTRLIEAVRNAELTPRPGTALDEWAWHRDEEGALLTSRLAGVELQNSLRPMLAVARFVAFAAKGLLAPGMAGAHRRRDPRARNARGRGRADRLRTGGAAHRPLRADAAGMGQAHCRGRRSTRRSGRADRLRHPRDRYRRPLLGPGRRVRARTIPRHLRLRGDAGVRAARLGRCAHRTSMPGGEAGDRRARCRRRRPQRSGSEDRGVRTRGEPATADHACVRRPGGRLTRRRLRHGRRWLSPDPDRG